MYAENELLYPSYVTSRLRSSRSELWEELVDRVSRMPQDDPEHLAFSLMMIRLNRCLRCETDSYRAMRGCMACTRQTLRRFKEPDEELLLNYREALQEMLAHLGTLPVEHIQRAAPAKAA